MGGVVGLLEPVLRNTSAVNERPLVVLVTVHNEIAIVCIGCVVCGNVLD